MKKLLSLLGLLAFQAFGITNVTLPYIVDTASIPKVRYVDKNDSALKWGVNNLGDTVNAATGTGVLVRKTSPTLTGTLAAASGTYSGTLGVTGNLTNTVLSGSGTRLVTATAAGLLGNALAISGNNEWVGTAAFDQQIAFAGVGTPGDWSLWRSATAGLALRGGAGSSYDFAVFNPTAAYLMRNPTGGSALEFPGSGVSVSGTLGVTGAATFNSTLALAGFFNLADHLVWTSATGNVRFNTSDGADNGRLTFNAGGSDNGDPARGAYLSLRGNENAVPGAVRLSAGNVTGGTIIFATGNDVPALTLNETQGATFSSTLGITSATASTAAAFDASKNLVSVTNTGSGSNVLATSPSIASPTISGNATFAGNILSNGGLAVGGGLYHSIFIENTNVTLDGTLTTMQADATSGSFTITLPAAASYAGTIYTVYKKDATSNTVTLDANASETINGALTLVLAGNSGNGRAQIMSNGTGWVVLDLYDEGTFTLTLTGVTASITGTGNAVRVGKKVTLEIPSLFGTSNTTGCTITGLPANWRPARTGASSAKYRASVYDNSAFQNGGEVSFSSTAGTIQLGSGGFTTFTSSGTKGLDGTAITYLLP